MELEVYESLTVSKGTVLVLIRSIFNLRADFSIVSCGSSNSLPSCYVLCIYVFLTTLVATAFYCSAYTGLTRAITADDASQQGLLGNR